MSAKDLEASLWEGVHERELVATVGLMTAVYRKVLEKLDLTPVQCTLLFRVEGEEGISQAELARETLRDRANVTRVVEGLVARRLVVRKEDESDRRKYRLHVTARGHKELARVRERVRRAARQLRTGIAPKDVESALRFLSKLKGNYKAFLDA